MVDEKSYAGRVILMLLAGMILIGAVVLAVVRVGPSPEINIRPGVPVIGRHTPVTIEVQEPKRGLSRVTVEFVQGSRIEKLADKSYSFPSWLNFWSARTSRDTITVTVGRDTIQDLQPGQAGIRVTAERTPTWLRHPDPVSQEILLPVRLKPPTLQVVSSQIYVNQGGCEAVVYRVGDSSVRDGVRAGKYWFPGYPLPGGGKGERFALFAAPYDMVSPDISLIAADEAGNEAELAFVDKLTPKKFQEDTVDLSDLFLNKVVREIMSQTPDLKDRGTVLDNYLAINRDLREKDAAVVNELARKSAREFLWNRPFLFMRNGKVMAGFADARTYSYQGKVVDHQTHLGYDLAVTKHAPVPATNDGVVLLAAYFGIYGNAVIIDHGFGIMSLYGHLSSIGVTVGQKVARGDIIGQTGETGLAGGDHLHFAILLNGLPVNPVEWWDAQWIRNRLAHKLGAGFPFAEASETK